MADIRYLPPALLQALRSELDDRAMRDVDPSDPQGAWGLERLCEQAFAVGHHEGYVRGYQSGMEAIKQRQRAVAEDAAKSDGAVQA